MPLILILSAFAERRLDYFGAVAEIAYNPGETEWGLSHVSGLDTDRAFPQNPSESVGQTA
ncbi:MAG: hypothetical protein BWX68_00105 [Verrucomicrobia bacterium ADurb.Bin063]|jgi:hypothetical protein|nr:MAG: hypothetical protein BWX68_00105 [Verrucomicrobia bacterium ADurb.Bin063]